MSSGGQDGAADLGEVQIDVGTSASLRLEVGDGLAVGRSRKTEYGPCACGK